LLEGSVPYDNTNFRLRGIEMPSGKVLWGFTDVLRGDTGVPRWGVGPDLIPPAA
jgi:hypothetical protein